ncbi:PAS domain-containing protein [Methylobacterium sp. Leaf118]|uniref:PAS domain-containing protein n=1 Tax=Methylobacterium sp. Leaf118 TaxID=2876562 RepID=UPI001E2B4F84|nr:PAS domain-containing protein [Methylobacterium sp. Leaf118]
MASDDWQLTERVRASVRSGGKGDPFAAAVRATRMAMIITDPRHPDNPIVFANDAFLSLTGYGRMEVMGRNCRFLQGPETDLDTVARIRAAIAAERDVHAELLNYRKDGSTFHNALFVSPVHDEDGTLLFFFASQLDVSDRYALKDERDRAQATLDANALLLREIGHRARNDLQTITAMLTLQSSGSADPAVRAALAVAIGRVDALGTLYRAPVDAAMAHDLADLAREVAGTLVQASGRRDLALDLDLAPVPVRAEAAGPLAIILNEAVMGALRPSGAGRLALQVAREGAEVVLRVGHGPVADQADASATGEAFGTDLVDALTRQLGGVRTPDGTTFRFPAERVTL